MDITQFKKTYEHKKVEENKNKVAVNPLVSVCIQTYQHVHYIKECLDGILNQKTNFDFEILLGEDASTDGTREICIDYAERYPEKIRLFLHHRENNISVGGKPSGRFNFLYNLYTAQGKYIALCEGDDYWTDPLKLQKQVDMLEKNHNLGLCFTDCKLVDTKNKVLKENFIPPKFQRELNQSDILSRFCPNTNTTLFRRELIVGINFENFKSVYNGDSFLFGFILQKLNAGYLPIKGGAYREHEGGIWSQKKQEFKLEKSIDTCLIIMKSYRVNEPQLFESYVDKRFRKLFALRKHIKAKQALSLLWKYMVFKWTFFTVRNSIFS